MTSVKVAVRVRPFNKRELEFGNPECCVEMIGKMTAITDPSTGQKKKFYYDHSYWSHDGFTTDPNTGMYEKDSPSSNYASQTTVFDDLGQEVIDNAFEGYHTCLFAYGQTGSGKSYSIFGYDKNIGIIPMACAEIFRRIELSQQEKGDEIQFQVAISMLEIYNECVQDLFIKPKKRPKGGLKIRETKKDGIYVEDLTSIPVNSYDDIADQIDLGTQNRTIGATNMNASSSRAHTVATITFTQTEYTMGQPTGKKKSNINLVDLAGSERQKSTGADADQLKEGSNINKSLSFLGKVISILADKAAGKKSAKNTVVPYRESKLTRILQNALSGNSKTSMIAAISPAAVNYEESYSTLLYANAVKAIKTNAVKNVSAKDKLIQELKEENKRLKEMMEKKQVLKQENKAEKKNEDIFTKVRIMNVNEDPMLNGKMSYAFKEGVNVIGRSKKGKKPDIVMSGLGIVNDHNKVSFDEKDKVLVLHPNAESFKKNKTYLNGELLKEDTQLKHGDKIIFGNNTVYVVLFPGEPITDEMRDYESAISKIHEQQLKALKDEQYEKEMKEKLSKIKDDMEKDRKNVEKGLKKQQKEMDEARKKLEEELRRRDEELKNKMKEAGEDKNKLSELEAKLKREKEDAERLRKLQEEKQKQLDEEKERALQAFDEAQKLRMQNELDMRFREKLDAQLTQMIQMCNDANEMCRTLGRYQYFYVPHIELAIMPDGTKVPKVICKAFPDKKKDFHNKLNFDEFEDKLYMMKEKWDQYMYEVENENNFSPVLEAGEDEGNVFGLSIRDDWHLIGNCYIFLYSLSAMLEVRKDHVPIIDTKGETKGTLCYSIEPIVYDEEGQPMEGLTSIYDLLGRNMTIEVCIHYSKEIPEKWSTNVFTEYNWIDANGRRFETEKSGDTKNKNPVWEYRHYHDILVTEDIINHIKESAFVMSVYGKLSPEDIEMLYEEFALNPTTNVLLQNKVDDDSSEDDEEEKDSTASYNRDVYPVGESEELIQMKKQLELIKKKNQDLKKEKITVQKENGKTNGCCCCNIF